MTRGEMTSQWNRIRDEAGLSGLRLHDLRHSSAIYQGYPAPISALGDYNTLI